MATTEEDDVPPETLTVGDQFGRVWEEVQTRTTDIVVARRGGPLWPFLLIGVVMTALQVRRPAATVLGALAAVALAAWVAAREVKR